MRQMDEGRAGWGGRGGRRDGAGAAREQEVRERAREQ